jgi:formate/nitrite transporter FocA (FNT family)
MPNHDPEAGLTPEEREEVATRTAPRSPVIHEVVREQGEDELARPLASLAWSGVAAGIAIMASVIAEAALLRKLPEAVPWREAAADLGYSLGFLIVILGRLQLFTEQTIVSALPVMAAPSWPALGRTARLWVVVFLANMAGAAAAAWMNLHLGLVGPELLARMLDVSAELLHRTPLETLAQAVPAGFLVATIAWLRVGGAGSEFWIVLALTSAIALGGFAHVVAGGAEAFLLVFDGRIGLGAALGGIILPALLGNVIGGTGLFALLAHGQVRAEL